MIFAIDFKDYFDKDRTLLESMSDEQLAKEQRRSERAERIASNPLTSIASYLLPIAGCVALAVGLTAFGPVMGVAGTLAAAVAGMGALIVATTNFISLQATAEVYSRSAQHTIGSIVYRRAHPNPAAMQPAAAVAATAPASADFNTASPVADNKDEISVSVPKAITIRAPRLHPPK